MANSRGGENVSPRAATYRILYGLQIMITTALGIPERTLDIPEHDMSRNNGRYSKKGILRTDSVSTSPTSMGTSKILGRDSGIARGTAKGVRRTGGRSWQIVR
jgi:hypothetical protein